jgi:hypothetical protein
VRRGLFRNRVPTIPGGGTVAYVNPSEHRYLDDPVEREEGGTPAIVESIRAGLVFQLKQAVGADTIQELERSFIRRAVASWGANPDIELLGNLEAERLSIVSFVVRHGSSYLHHTFVVALLNDLFGIQSRGGSCAGPYGHRLLGSTSSVAPVRAGDHPRVRGHQARLGPGELQLLHLRGHLRVPHRGRPPGRGQGPKLLGDYRFDPASGRWRHRAGPVEPPLHLDSLRYDTHGRLRFPSSHAQAQDALAGYLQEARRLLATRPDPPKPTAGRSPGCRPTSRRCAGSSSHASACPASSRLTAATGSATGPETPWFPGCWPLPLLLVSSTSEARRRMGNDGAGDHRGGPPVRGGLQG